MTEQTMTEQTAIRQTIIGIVAQFLPEHAEALRPEDDVFKLGCTSLMAVAIADRVSRELEIEYTLLSLLSAPTIGGIEAVVEASLAARREEADDSIEEGEL